MSVVLSVQKNDTSAKPTRYYSKKQETSVASAINGKVQVNSGATDFKKGDVYNDLFLVECKTKVKTSDSISIKKDWVVKNNHERAFMGKPYSALAFSFGPNETNYYVIDEDMFKYLNEKLREDIDKLK